MSLLARRAIIGVTDLRPLLHVTDTYRRGRRGDVVTLIQEWLCLNLCDVMIDGQFGYATEQAVKDFQGGVVRTIEGNSAYSTDDEPSGHEVCRQMRSYGNLDFIVLD